MKTNGSHLSTLLNDLHLRLNALLHNEDDDLFLPIHTHSREVGSHAGSVCGVKLTTLSLGANEAQQPTSHGSIRT